MGLKKGLFAAAGVLVLAAAGIALWVFTHKQEAVEMIPDNALLVRPTVTLWYTDEALEDYLASMALDYLEEYDVRVVPVQKSGLEYLEAVNQASVANENLPDLYIVGNESLEKAYLAGLAAGISNPEDVISARNFPQTALDAVTYQGKMVAYPLYFETSALVYNRTYLQQAAQELGVGEETLIPKTIDDILSFAENYNAPETVEAVFKWDVADIFYNYFFAGNYMDVGGPCGDDENRIDIYNLEAVRGLQTYQDLNQFFSIDAKNSSYDSVVQDFLDGKLVFTVATTDILNRIAQAREEGLFPYEYGVVPLPDINGEVQSRGLSVTSVVAVNGYSTKKDLANYFAAWLSTFGQDKLYARAKRIPVRLRVVPEAVGMEGFMEEYSYSIPMPKLMSMANFWVRMEIAYTKIWSGENASDILKNLSEQIMTQVTGTEYVETEYIELPKETQTETQEDEDSDS